MIIKGEWREILSRIWIYISRNGMVSSQRFAAQLDAVDLQWFAAEDEGRTEDPSEHKLRKAREEGKVIKSQDVNIAIILLFTAVGLAIAARHMMSVIFELLSFYWTNVNTLDVSSDGIVRASFFSYFLRAVGPIVLVGFVSGLIASFLQVGPLFTLKTITPDFKKILPNFSRYLKQSLFSAEAGFNFAKSLGKIAIIGAIAYLNVYLRIEEALNLLWMPLLASIWFIVRLAFSITIQVGVVLLLLSVFDYLFQRRRHYESLKMSRQEVKEERKTIEGDPLMRSRLRQRIRQVMSNNIAQEVPTADVVITNPTHFAVALRYRKETMSAPTVIAKGQDEMAARIRKIAGEHNIPVVENKPLARALHSEVEIGDTIPEKFYEAVVVVLREIYRTKGQYAWQQ